MACTDIRGNEVTRIKLGDDGIVYGINDSVETSYTLGAECCNSFGYTFDPTLATCFWSNVTSVDEINVYLNPENDGAGFYQIPENGVCEFDISFDWLILFSCDKLFKCGLTPDDLINLKVDYFLEVLDVRGARTIVDRQTIFDGTNITGFNSGLLLGYNRGKLCNANVSNLLLGLPPQTQHAVNSSWVTFEKLYLDGDFLSGLTGNQVRIGFTVYNVPCGFSIKVDNVKMMNNCQVKDIKKTTILKNPSYNFDKIVDNKKSWVVDDLDREHDLKYRETSYITDDDRLVHNSKEIDLHFSSDNGIEHDIWVFIKNNPTLLSGTTVDGIDLLALVDFDYSTINNLDDFMYLLNTKLIDAKSRKTINAYPTLKLVYYRYVNSFLYTGVQSNAFTYQDMLEYIDIMDNYWLELVEQFIPSTSIWGSTIKITNSTFDSEKYVYKKGSLLVIKGEELSEFIATESVSVSVSEAVGGATNTYSSVGMKQIHDGSEFYGKVTILSPDNNDPTGDVLVLTEAKDSMKQLL